MAGAGEFQLERDWPVETVKGIARALESARS
jgi:hypothetical protein